MKKMIVSVLVCLTAAVFSAEPRWKYTLGENEIKVAGGAKPPVAAFSGHNDHRIVMAAALLAAKLGGRITGAEAIAKSYPDFFSDLQKIQIKVEIENGMDLKE